MTHDHDDFDDFEGGEDRHLEAAYEDRFSYDDYGDYGINDLDDYLTDLGEEGPF